MVSDDGEQLLAPQFAHTITAVCVEQQLVCGAVHWLSRSIERPGENPPPFDGGGKVKFGEEACAVNYRNVRQR